MYSEQLPPKTPEEIKILMTQLDKLGFIKGWWKDGLNMSGHSQLGTFDNVNFRIMFTFYGAPNNNTEIIFEANASTEDTAKQALKKF